MSLIVSDASPVNYLILINAIDVLPNLFSKIVVPEYIISIELQNPKTPPDVREWVKKLPSWVEVRNPSHLESFGLHRGEEHAISLALELNAPVLLDEREARNIAEGRGLVVVGLVGIVERAASRKLLDIRTAFAALNRTNFRISESLIEAAIKRHTRVKPPQG